MLEITLTTSKTCGLIYFVDAIAGRPNSTTEVRDWYMTQESTSPELDKEVCEKYSRCLDEAGNDYDADDCVGRRMTLSQRIATSAAECESLDELLDNFKTILPPVIQSTLRSAFEYFEPIYHACIWNPCCARLFEQLAEFRVGIERVEMTSKLEQVKEFLGAAWPENTPLELLLIPLPDEPMSAHADSVGRMEIIEVPSAVTFDERSDTVFHELCHSLYGRIDQEKIQDQFAEIGSIAPFYELNEGLATALGQGWFRKHTYPTEPDRKVWYGRDITDNYGRGLYPLVDEYLSERRGFDVDFVRRASQIFTERCPQVELDVTYTYATHIIYEKLPDYDRLQNAMFEAMPNIRRTDWTALASANFSLKPEQLVHARQIVLLSPDAIRSLKHRGLTGAQVAALTDRVENCIAVACDKSEIIFCVGATVKAQEEVFLEMLKTGYPKCATIQPTPRKISPMSDQSDADEAARELKFKMATELLHELRTPLGGIIGINELMLMSELNAEQKQFADTIQDSAKSMLQLLTDAVEYARLDAKHVTAKASSFSLQTTLEECKFILRKHLKVRQIELEVQHSHLPATVTTDPQLVQQFITSIVLAASKYVESGTIKLDVQNLASPAQSPTIQFTFFLPPNTVNRSGQNLFYQLGKESEPISRFDATWLRLSIAQMILKAMSAKIKVDKNRLTVTCDFQP